MAFSVLPSWVVTTHDCVCLCYPSWSGITIRRKSSKSTDFDDLSSFKPWQIISVSSVEKMTGKFSKKLKRSELVKVSLSRAILSKSYVIGIFADLQQMSDMSSINFKYIDRILAIKLIDLAEQSLRLSY